MSVPLHGLVLSGGRSRRMRRDKSRLDYHGSSQIAWTTAMLEEFCDDVRVSLRPGQEAPADVTATPLFDRHGSVGPLDGIVSALEENPEVAWLVVACDLPLLNRTTLQALTAGRDSSSLVTAFRSAKDGLPEPLCGIYEPGSLPILTGCLNFRICCPRKILIHMEIPLLDLASPQSLHNVNTPEEYEHLRRELLIGSG